VQREDNIKMRVKEMGHKNMNLIHLSHDKVHWWGIVNTFVFNERENFITLATAGFSK